jgi:transposase
VEADIVQLAELVWGFLKPHLPGRKPNPKGGRPPGDDYQALLGICFVLKTGARWKDIPKGSIAVSYPTCWRRCRDWSGEGFFEAAWARALAKLAKKRPARGRTGAVDGSYVRGKKGATKSAAAARATAAR